MSQAARGVRGHDKPRAAHYLCLMRPTVLVPACRRAFTDLTQHFVGEKYLTALAEGSGVAPLIVPALGGPVEGGTMLREDEVQAWLDMADGLFLTGSASNVEPYHYEGHPSAPGTRHDPARDATMLPTIRAAIARGMPVFAVCRGIQELNVALGGTLFQSVHTMPGRFDHLGDSDLPADVRYGPRHTVRFTPGGLIEQLMDGRPEAMVSSFHRQAVDRPADGAAVEAVARDGTIEAIRVTDAPYFGLGVQWHPEHRYGEDALSRVLFAAFGEGVRAYARDRGGLAAGSRAAAAQ